MTEPNMDIKNITNYKNKLEYSTTIEYYFKYIELIHNFLMYYKESILIKDPKFNKYIIIKGIEMVTNIFNLLLLYTKNIELTVYNAQKGYCYYLEFIGQIESESNTFLHLSVKDAILFVYRKTIFLVNDDMKKDIILSSPESDILSRLHRNCDIYNISLFKTIENFNEVFQKGCDKRLIKIMKNNTYLINKYIECDDDLIIIRLCNIIINKIYGCKFTIGKSYLIIELFIKKYKSRWIDDEFTDEKYDLLERSILNTHFTDEVSHVKIVNDIFYSPAAAPAH